MAKTIKSLLRISMVIRNLGTLNNCTIAKRFLQTSASCCSNYNKDSLVSARPHLVSQNTHDPPQITTLQSTIKNSDEMAEIFHIVKVNSATMSAADAVVALEALFLIDKRNSQKTKRIYEKKEFLALCEIVNKNIRQLGTNEAILMLKTLIYFDVPGTSIIVQAVLQMLRHSVNLLSLQQITFVDFLLSKCEKTPLAEALKIALPIVFESNVAMKLDRENIQSIALALKYLSRKSTNAEVFTIIIAAMRNCNQPMDPLMAKSVLWSLCDLRCFPQGLPAMINSVQTLLAENISSLDRVAVKHLISLLSEKIRYREKHFYHERFADACASLVISEDWGFKDAVYVLDKLLIMGHMQISLLDYIAGKCFEDPTILETCHPKYIAIIVAGFSAADYKPVFWDVIQESVVSDRVLEAKSSYPQSKLAVHLTSLDCYCPKLLENIFTFNRKSLPSQKTEKGRLLLLYQAVKTLYPQYTGPWPDENIVNFLPPEFKQTDEDFPLLASMECALGGRRYVLTNVRSKLGHLIDHVLVMRKGGFPIAINNEASSENTEYPIVSLEEIQPPPDSQVILILYMPAHAYSVNSERMKGVWSLQIKSLEALSNHTVIPIQSTMWTSLPDSEKIPYLMQAIRLKCEEVSISANS